MFWILRILLIVAVVPGAVLMYLVYRQDRVEKEPPKLLAKLFVFGALTVISALILEAIGTYIVTRALWNTYLPFAFCYFFLVVGLSEELGKFVVLKLVTWNRPEFNFRFDGIVYAAFAGMGFAIVENVIYVFSNGLATGLLRAVTAIPGHMTFAIFMGHFYGQAKLCESRGDREGKTVNLWLSYLVPVAIHGLYDTLASLGYTFTGVLFVVFILLMDFLAYRRVKQDSDADVGFRVNRYEYMGNNGYSNGYPGDYGNCRP